MSESLEEVGGSTSGVLRDNRKVTGFDDTPDDTETVRYWSYAFANL